MFNFTINCQTFLQWLYQFSFSLALHVVFTKFQSSSWIYSSISLWFLMCSSLITSYVEHLFMHFYDSLLWQSVYSSCLLLGVLLNCGNSINIVCTSSLSGMYFVNVFSHPVTFPSLNMALHTFSQQKLCNFDEVYFIISFMVCAFYVLTKRVLPNPR